MTPAPMRYPTVDERRGRAAVRGRLIACARATTRWGIMESVTTLPWGRPLTREDLDRIPFLGARAELIDGSMVLTGEQRTFTREDLDQAPEDGHRYELIDGALVVTPAPSVPHQRMSLRLARLLDDAKPDHLEVLTAPVDVALADAIMQPDLLVARRADFTHRDLPVPPLLAVEVLSPNTRLLDLGLKKARYEQARVPSYWVVDPDTGDFTAWELAEDTYVEVARIGLDESWTAARPFEVTISPTALTG